MEFNIKTFEELTKHELYDLLKLRSEVFVVEQECAYQDVDGKDHKAFHVLAKNQGVLVAYTRIFKPGEYFENTSIGRVVVAKEARNSGYGQEIMLASMRFITQTFGEAYIELSAQTYLTKFYNNLGFQTEGEEYLEDGIPHIKMTYQAKS